MSLKVEIDKHSGFCGGVIRAISQAEEYLKEHQNSLYSLGAIVHNEEELNRLAKKGLKTLEKEEFNNIKQANSNPLLIRAHGEPPKTYITAQNAGFDIIDCTCPVVLRLQKKIKSAWEQLKKDNGELVIFGKPGHAEVLGLMGQTNGEAIVVKDCEMLLEAIESKKLLLNSKVEIFSQTTKSPSEYKELCSLLENKMAEKRGESLGKFRERNLFRAHDTICRQVASRHSDLVEFAKKHDIIIFVAGKASSNGKVLCDLCNSVNTRTYHVTGADKLNANWFKENDNVGVCGATSTPKWLLENVAKKIINILK